MSHKSGHVIISRASEEKFDKMPPEIRDQVTAILERANKQITELIEDAE